MPHIGRQESTSIPININACLTSAERTQLNILLYTLYSLHFLCILIYAKFPIIVLYPKKAIYCQRKLDSVAVTLIISETNEY